MATFWDLVVAAADAHPERVLIADSYGRELTTERLRDAAEQAAAGLGITAGDVVSWQLPTVLESVVLMAAVARVGALQNPIIPLLRGREIQLIATQLGTTKLVVPTAWRGFDYAAVLRAGGRLVLYDHFDPATTPQSMADHRPTILGTATPFFRAYLDAQRYNGPAPLYPQLRAFVAGGASLSADLLTELADTFPAVPVVNSWGLTEFPVAASTAWSDPPDVLAATVGRAAPRVAVRVVDGELRLKGPQQFLGYVDPALDPDAFDEGGWFKTGDLGQADGSGFITITGRLKDVIIRNAENISALEVEEILLRHLGIADVAVIGLPDARTGERVCAVVVVVEGSQVSLESLSEHCAAQGLPRQKFPERLAVVEALVRNPMGKVVKSELRAQVLAGQGVTNSHCVAGAQKDRPAHR